MRVHLDYSRVRATQALSLTTTFELKEEDLRKLIAGKSLSVDASPGMMGGPPLKVKFDIYVMEEEKKNVSQLLPDKAGKGGALPGASQDSQRDGGEHSLSGGGRSSLSLPERSADTD